MKPRKWTMDQLRATTPHVASMRELLASLRLRPAGGNYSYIKRQLVENGISTNHFRRTPWNKGRHTGRLPLLTLEDILVDKSSYQSAKLRRRLFAAGLKKPECELCGWSVRTPDGRIPLELDHINGIREDNRLENLRILCPNCHSLQPTHRGLNIGKRRV